MFNKEINLKILAGSIFFLLSLTPLLCFAENISSDTIPVITYKSEIFSSTSPNTMDSSYLHGNELQSFKNSKPNQINANTYTQIAGTVNNIPTSNLKKLIQQVKESVCETLVDSDVRVWISADGDAKVFGLGVSGQSGIEVTFHCKSISLKNSKT